MFRKAARGFTLIELMIVVAIIGILAAIAIPNFMRYQLRSKRTEGSVNVAGLRTAEIAYYGTHDVYVAAAAYPDAATLGSTKREWVRADALAFSTELGWAPEGQVYSTYQVTTGDTDQSFMIAGATNLDVDSTTACWGYAKPTSAGVLGAAIPGLGCAGGAAAPADSTEKGWEKVELLTGDDVF